MLRTHLLLAFRHLRKEKGYTVVSIVGLVLAFTACFFTLSFIVHELSPDQNFVETDRLYRVKSTATFGDNTIHMTYAPMAVAAKLKEEFPEIEAVIPVVDPRGESVIHAKNGQFVETKWAYSTAEFIGLFDSSYFSIELPFKVGSVLLSETLSKKIFGTRRPIGEVLRFGLDDFVVAGTFKDFPSNSHLQVNAVAISVPSAEFHKKSAFQYVKLSEQADVNILNHKLTEKAEVLKASVGPFTYSLEPTNDLYANGSVGNLVKGADMTLVKILAITSFIILLISSINVINHTQLKCLYRGREVGVKKVMGVSRPQLFFQFFVESLLIVLLAILLSMSLIQVIGTEVFVHLGMTSLYQSFALSALSGIALVLILLLSFSQSMLFAGTMPRKVMAGNYKIGAKRNLVSALIALQFVITSFLIGVAVIVQEQMNYIANRPMGFEIKDLWFVHASKDDIDLRLLKSEAEGIPGVESATISSSIPFGSFSVYANVSAKSKATILYAEVDKDFFSTFKTSFIEEPLHFPPKGFILNAAAAEKKEDLELAGSVSEPLLGVVADFHTKQMSQVIAPLKLAVADIGKGYLTIRASEKNFNIVKREMGEKWSQLYPNQPFELSSLENLYISSHASVKNLQYASNCISLIAIFISCVGLSSLIGYFVKKRFKEIAIRRVLGANISQVVKVVNIKYFILVGGSSIASLPFLYTVANDWLADFAYHVQIQLWMLLIPFLIVVVTSASIMLIQSWKTALANPVEALRAE